MNDYRANRVSGQPYFFTVRLTLRCGVLLTDHIAAFGEAMRQARSRKPFHVDAWVVLPDHAHTIWTLPPDDHDCMGRWRAVKIAFSKALRKSALGAVPDTLWERQFRQVTIDDDTHYSQLIDYIHANPVRHGLCERALDWPWSSWHRFRAAGLVQDEEPALALDALPPVHSPARPRLSLP